MRPGRRGTAAAPSVWGDDMGDRYYVTDSDLSERFPLYTRANVGEVFPDPVTPLTSDTALWYAELGWRDAWVRMGAFEADEFPDDQYCQLGVQGGYCYLNASLIRLFGERAPGLSWQAMDDTFFGAQPGIPPYSEMPGDVRPDLSERIGETFGWVFAQTALSDLTELTADRDETKQMRHDRPDYSTWTELQLWQRYLELVPYHRTYFAHHLFTTYMATVPVGAISAVATAVGRPDLILPILAGIGEVDSAAPSHAMWAMSRMDPDSDEFRTAFDEFLYEFGSRGPNEWEARSPTWETRPALALAAIDRMRGASDDADPALHNAERARQREAAAAELLAMVEGDPATHGQLAAAIACSAAWLPGRERTKTNNIRCIHEMRMAMREFGARMVAKGAFDEIEDFGFLRMAEVEACIDDPHAFTDTIRERRSEYRRLQELVPPFVFVGRTDGPDTWVRRDAPAEGMLGAGDTMAGLPGCPGHAEGIARVILDSNDPTALEPGDILVAPITDPSWTPLFVPAAGVVVDVGAALSHAIIVSRELGIPCVISATDATRRIPDGSRIRVDGSTGAVTVLELA
ncbi:MAG: phosphoenolpyruvate-utilizing protein [Acidimicrobiaceae bacterium]|nr:phosphoenolpyruvate-utilizing protein [Acidimicrobiaceae bacterium]